MTSCCLILLALLAPWQFLATVSGQVLDAEAKPLAGATVTYTYFGVVEKDPHVFPGMRTETPKMFEKGGRKFNVKADKKGAFIITGLDFGVYQIEITGPDGRHIYSGKKNIGETKDINTQNVLNVDLSLAVRGPVAPGAETNLASGKKTKDQLELIRQENANAVKINRLIGQYKDALYVQDWPTATGLLQQLIALDTHRWEFYQNLGTLQSNQMHYKEAAESFAQGVSVAEKTLANPSYKPAKK